MAAKSILNELYQRLRTAAPVYKTQAEDHSEGFVCFLTLPSVKSEWDALSADKTFEGRGSSKKESEHAAANAAVEWLTAEKVLRPDPAAASHSSRGTAGPAPPSPTASSATSGVSLSGVGSKRSKSSADHDEESTENLELRILEALAGAYPRTLNGAQLAKMCGHFKLKSKVNHLLYMRLRTAGLVEMLGTHPPAWKVAGPALAAVAAAAGGETAQAAATASTASDAAPAGSCAVGAASAAGGPAAAPSVTTDTVAGAGGDCEVGEVTSAVRGRPPAIAPAAVAHSNRGAALAAAVAAAAGSSEAVECISACSRGVARHRQPTPTAVSTPPPVSLPALTGGGSPEPYARQSAAKPAKEGAGGTEQQQQQQQQQQLGMFLQHHQRQQQKVADEIQGAAAAAAAVAGLGLGQRQHVPKAPAAAVAAAAAAKARVHSPSPSYSYGQSLHTHSHSQAYSQHSLEQQQQQSRSCGRSTTVTAATAAAARRQHARAVAATAAVGGIASAAPAASHGGSEAHRAGSAGMRLAAGSGTDTDDDDISPAVLAAASEAAALEPAPFAAQPSSGSLSRHHSQPTLPASIVGAAAADAVATNGRSGAARWSLFSPQQQQHDDLQHLMLPHLDLLAAMQLNEQPQQWQGQQRQQQPAASPLLAAKSQSGAAEIVPVGHQQGHATVQQDLGSEQPPPWAPGGASTALQQQLQQLLHQQQAGSAGAAAGQDGSAMSKRCAARPQLEAGTKRKYPAFSSGAWEEGRDTAASADEALGGPAAWQEATTLATAAGQQQSNKYPLWPAALDATAMHFVDHDQMQEDAAIAQQDIQQAQQFVEQLQLNRAFRDGQGDHHQQPQRRRRRSGQDPSARIEAQARRQDAGHWVHVGGVSPTHSNAASSDGGSCDVEVSASMQLPTAVVQGTAAGHAEMPVGAGAAADLAAALLNLSAGSHAPQPGGSTSAQQQQQQQLLFSPSGGTAPRLLSGLKAEQPAMGQTRPQIADVLGSGPRTLWGAGGPPAVLGFEAQAAISAASGAPAAHGASMLACEAGNNPWQWQWQGQQQLFTAQPQQLQGGSQLPSLAQRQQQQQEGLWSSGLQQQQHHSPAHKTLRQLSPSPSPSGVSLGASMVVGGPTRGTGGCNSMGHSIGVEYRSPGMPAASGATSASPGPTAAASVKQQEVASKVADHLPPPAQQQQQGSDMAAVDLQHSEEQALQLLSRLALPGPATVGGGATNQLPIHSTSTQLEKISGVAAPATRLVAEGSRCDALREESIICMRHSKGANNPVSIAVAAAAAASKAAAAMAAAASFARVGHVSPASGSNGCHVMGAQSAGAAAVTNTTAPEVSTRLRVTDNVELDTLPLQQVSVVTDPQAQSPGATADVTAQAPTAAAATAVQPAVLPTVLPGTAVLPAELAEEYERRMGAVQDLVQQLNEALQGLNSIREKVEGA